jgi:hypothetical protein
MCRGTRWPISAWSASNNAEGFNGFPFRKREGLKKRECCTGWLDRRLKVRQAVRVVRGTHGADVAPASKAKVNFAAGFLSQNFSTAAEGGLNIQQAGCAALPPPIPAGHALRRDRPSIGLVRRVSRVFAFPLLAWSNACGKAWRLEYAGSRDRIDRGDIWRSHARS